MPKVKIFKSHVNEVNDTNSIESSLNHFVKNKTIISITQSITATPAKPDLYFMVVTVIYEDKKPQPSN